MIVGFEKFGIFLSQVDQLFEMGAEQFEVIRGTRLFPDALSDSGLLGESGYPFSCYFGIFVKMAPGYFDQTGVIRVFIQGLGIY